MFTSESLPPTQKEAITLQNIQLQAL